MSKIQVQGIGMYDDKTLKKKIIQLVTDLQKNAKKGDWNKASENGIRALGRMWNAYQDWARNNESIDESDLGLTYKKGKTIKVTHKTSGREIIIIDKPNVRKEYQKIGYYAESVNERAYAHVRKSGDDYMGGYNDNKGNDTEMYKSKKDGTFYIWVKSNGSEAYMDLPKNIKDRSKADVIHNKLTTSFKTKKAPKIKLKSRWKHNQLPWMRGPKKESVNEGPDIDLHNKLSKKEAEIIQLVQKFKNKANVPAIARSWMLGLHNKLKKQGIKLESINEDNSWANNKAMKRADVATILKKDMALIISGGKPRGGFNGNTGEIFAWADSNSKRGMRYTISVNTVQDALKEL